VHNFGSSEVLEASHIYPAFSFPVLNSHMLSHAAPKISDASEAREIPPPTPITFPQRTPSTEDQSTTTGGLLDLIHSIYRPGDVKSEHLEALGLHLTGGVSPEALVPCDPITNESYLPSSVAWNAIPPENLIAINDSTRKTLNNGNLSPGAQTYIERQNELSIANAPAFRTIRRLPAPPGTNPARLGNAYEFFKNLELLSAYWDDTSLPAPSGETSISSSPAPADLSKVDDGDGSKQLNYARTSAGSSTPNEYRLGLISAFIKLVAYDFGCSVSQARTEPRLYIPGSYFQSNVNFIYRTPITRSEARSGIVEGPVAALSVRPSTSFTAQEETLDLAREAIASLLTAQLRSREGKTELRIGEGKWWCSAPRWGGGTGGPIGKEETLSANNPNPGSIPEVESEGREKKRRNPNKKTLSMYDTYRMVRPPASNWDRKAKYLAIGKAPGADYDDIFVFSSLYHHIAILRVRVPGSLLREMSGEDLVEGRRIEMLRSKWYDLFKVEERVEAMQCIWGVMAYLMRKTDS
jgi:hypothetical protein